MYMDIQRKKAGIIDITGYRKVEQHKVNFLVCLISYIHKENKALFGDVLLLSLPLYSCYYYHYYYGDNDDDDHHHHYRHHHHLANALCPQLKLSPLNMSYNLSSLGRFS